jgi:hypothetical protein
MQNQDRTNEIQFCITNLRSERLSQAPYSYMKGVPLLPGLFEVGSSVQYDVKIWPNPLEANREFIPLTLRGPLKPFAISRSTHLRWFPYAILYEYVYPAIGI